MNCAALARLLFPLFIPMVNKMKQDTLKMFQNDIENHAITIIKDDGIYRHIHCANKDKAESWNQWFDIITWPNHLTICGDMGTYVFSRVEDMFNFFRRDVLSINEGYWAEKLQASDHSRQGNGVKEYCDEVFAAAVGEEFNDYVKNHRLSKEKKNELWDEIKDNVLDAESEEQAHIKAGDFQFEGFQFYDFWEKDLKKYTTRYLWDLYAIVWTIQQYDKIKAAA